MKKLITLTVVAVLLSTASWALGSIAGVLGVCVGNTSSLSADSTTFGGVWSSSNTAVATVDPSSGVVTGVAVGTATISYTVGSSIVTALFTVSSAPAPITGGGTGIICAGTTIVFSDPTPGGTWSSSDTTIATIGMATGVALGAGNGVTIIHYFSGTGCSATFALTVNAPVSGSLYGDSSICVGATTSLTTSLSGGTWSSSNPAVASVDAVTGLITGVSLGSATISYATAGTCGGSMESLHITVINTTMAPGAITGPTTAYVTATIYLSDSVAGGTWSSSNTAIATVDASGGVTGVSAGTVTITYTVSGCGGILYATTTITVVPFNGISGQVFFPSGYSGPVKVWLITYNPATFDLEASDSLSLYCSGTSVHYQFLGMPTDSFRVKAAPGDSTIYTSGGYIPTYHTSSFYWNSATVLYHTAGTADINQDINMMSGVSTGGPGFVAGNVTTGANKGTSGSVPVVGLKMYLVNTTTGQLVQLARTDATGYYSFSSVPVGATYMVFPDSLNYLTTPYNAISLTASAPSLSGAGFVQHTISHTITPVPVSVTNAPGVLATITAFPNPTSGRLNIIWQLPVAETGHITITDVTGREVYSKSIEMTQGSGTAGIDLASFTPGLYLLSVKSGSLSYNTKIRKQ